jgi:MFS family permease
MMTPPRRFAAARRSFMNRVPVGVNGAGLRLLVAVGVALMFEEYDLAIVTAALKQISAELALSEERMPLGLALMRLGALPAFVFVPFADRWGRRPVFLASIVGMGLFTFATAFVQNASQFVLMQALTRACFVTGSATAFVIMAEELPAAHRGWGMGMLAALGACGHGLGALLFSQIERLPYGWRALYAVGLVPVLMSGYFARRVIETRRFSDHASTRAKQPPLRAWLAPLGSLATRHPLRAAALALSGVLMAFATLPSFQLSGYFVQSELGFTPARYSAMIVIGGGVGILGNMVGGRLGDSLGRKRVGIVLLSGFPLAAFGFFRGGPVGAMFAWVALVFTFMGGRLILRALSIELFPTAQRAAAAGMFSFAEAMGAVIGLLAIYAYDVRATADLARVVPAIACVTLLAALLVLVFPETRQRELEDIN